MKLLNYLGSKYDDDGLGNMTGMISSSTLCDSYS